MNFLITFFTHFDAIECRNYLQKYNVKGILQPVPRKVSSSCGTCLTFEAEDVIFDSLKLTSFNGISEVFSVDKSQYTLIFKNE